jgi:DNA-binding CsgD family transcriptional regulator
VDKINNYRDYLFDKRIKYFLNKIIKNKTYIEIKYYYKISIHKHLMNIFQLLNMNKFVYAIVYI